MEKYVEFEQHMQAAEPELDKANIEGEDTLDGVDQNHLRG